MTKEQIQEASEVARKEALNAPEHAYAAVFSTVFSALVYEPLMADNRTAAAINADVEEK